MALTLAGGHCDWVSTVDSLEAVMGFSVKLAPGVRVRASSRGVRTSIGPRAARLHVGSGRTGFSTGAGPVGYYTSVGGSGRRSTRSSSSGAANRQLAQAARTGAMEDKAAEAKLLADALTGILDLHRAEFLPASPPRAEPAPAINQTAIRDKHMAAAKRSTSIFDRTGRKAALAEADRLSLEEIRNIEADAER